MGKLIIGELRIKNWNVAEAECTYIDGTTSINLTLSSIPINAEATQSVRTQIENNIKDEANAQFQGIIPSVGQNDIDFLC